MTKLVLHLFHNDPAALSTVPMLAERLRGLALESAASAFPRFAAEGATVVTF